MQNFDYCVFIWSCVSFIKYVCSNCQKNNVRRAFHTAIQLWHTFTDYFVNDRQVEIEHSKQHFAQKYDISLILKLWHHYTLYHACYVFFRAVIHAMDRATILRAKELKVATMVATILCDHGRDFRFRFDCWNCFFRINLNQTNLDDFYFRLLLSKVVIFGNLR